MTQRKRFSNGLVRAILFIILGLTIFAFLPYACTVHASTTTTFQPPADNSIWEENADTNYGTLTRIEVQATTNKVHRSILKFDMSGTIPSGATVISASLSLYYYGSAKDPVGRTYQAYRIIQTGWTELGSTWNCCVE